jgi:hypothetical protein
MAMDTSFSALPQFDLFGAQEVNIVVVAIGILASALFFGSAVSFAKERTGWRLVQLFGSFCWVVVVLAHIAEAFHLLGHYEIVFRTAPVITLISLAPSLA